MNIFIIFILIIIIWALIVYYTTKLLNSNRSGLNMSIILASSIFILISGLIILYIMYIVFKSKEPITFPKFSDDEKGIVII